MAWMSVFVVLLSATIKTVFRTFSESSIKLLEVTRLARKGRLKRVLMTAATTLKEAEKSVMRAGNILRVLIIEM